MRSEESLKDEMAGSTAVVVLTQGDRLWCGCYLLLMITDGKVMAIVIKLSSVKVLKCGGLSLRGRSCWCRQVRHNMNMVCLTWDHIINYINILAMIKTIKN